MSSGPETAYERETNPGSPIHRAQHRISVFGSGSEGKKYRRTLKYAKEVARSLMLLSGFKLATGGINTGVMRVVAHEAMRIVRKEKRKDLIPEAVAPKGLARWSRTPGKTQAEKKDERTKRLVDESEGYVVLNGSFGTDAELDYALRDETRAALHKPIVILDESDQHLHLIKRKIRKGTVTEEMLEDVYVAKSPEEAQFVLELYYRKRYGLPIDNLLIEKLFPLHISHHLATLVDTDGVFPLRPDIDSSSKEDPVPGF